MPQDRPFIEKRLERIERLLERLDDKLTRVLAQGRGDKRRDIAMAKGQEKLSAEIEDLSKKVDDYTTARGQEIADAVAEARTAWEEENEKAFEDAVTKIDEIGNRLVKFDPSGNPDA
jgi:hypothetical protein